MAKIILIFFFLWSFTTQGQFLSLNQKLFLTKDVHFDVEVAADETGNYTKVMDAVNVAPKSKHEIYDGIKCYMSNPRVAIKACITFV